MSEASAIARVRGVRIAHLIETDGPGGAERMVAELAASFAAAGCPGVVVVPREGEGWLARELAATGVAIEHFKLERTVSPRFARELAAILRAHRVDVAHSHDFTMGAYGAWAARSAGIPHVITMHGGRYYASAWHRRLALQIAARTSAGVVAVSTELADHLARDLHVSRARVLVIPNGVRERVLPTRTLRDELALPPSASLALAIGNLYPVKGHTHLVAALARLHAKYPELHVAIGGRGDCEAELRAEALRLGVADRVHLLGFRSDIEVLLAGADLFVHPSLAEGLPLAVLEAMFAARPIVASRVGEIPEVLGADGILVPAGDDAAIAAAVDRLLSDRTEARALGGRAQQRARSTYALAASVERYAELFARLVA